VAIRRSSADVSVAYLGVLLVGFMLWLSYGIALHDAPLIVSNVVALATNVVTIATVLRFAVRPNAVRNGRSDRRAGTTAGSSARMSDNGRACRLGPRRRGV
jgi:MtN3 and saliva related transmembrane protein